MSPAGWEHESRRMGACTSPARWERWRMAHARVPQGGSTSPTGWAHARVSQGGRGVLVWIKARWLVVTRLQWLGSQVRQAVRPMRGVCLVAVRQRFPGASLGSMGTTKHPCAPKRIFLWIRSSCALAYAHSLCHE